MTVDLVVKGGRIVTPQGEYSGGVAIDEGKIVASGALSTMPAADRSIDASELFVLPGVIDGHVHFREPGLEHKEDFQTGTMAAAAGGVTTILDMPNVNPPTADSSSFQLKLGIAKEKAIVDFGIFGVVTPANIDRVQELASQGVIGFKIFMEDTVGSLASPDDWELVLAFREIARTGLRVGVHAENRGITAHLVGHLKAQGRTDPLAHLESRPSISEAEATARAITLARPHGTKIHIFHLSSEEGVQIVQEAKERAVPVTAETCPHYLLIDGREIQKLGPLLKINPPVRSGGHAKALWKGLKTGAVDMIATDHSPHTREEKFKPNIWDAVAGWPGVETMLPLLLSEVNKGTLTMGELTRYVSENPAKVWGMYPQKGSIEVGSDGDLTLVDLKARGTIRADKLHSKSKFTPFDGWVVNGLPTYSIVRGRVVMEKGEVLEDAGRGRLVVPNAVRPQR